MKKFLLILALMLTAMICNPAFTDSLELEESELEETAECATLYVTANRLNGRSAPRKRGFVECIFDSGDALTATGQWSSDHKWIEVLGGEGGTVWVDIRYVTETKKDIFVMSLHPNRIRIRNKPVDGKTKGYLGKNKKLRISQVVLGWGKCATGWIDLSYLIELDE